MSFAEKLKITRKERGITQEQLAEMLSVSRQAVSKWESGAGFPETEKLLTLSKELNVSLDYLLLEEDVIEKRVMPNHGLWFMPQEKSPYRYMTAVRWCYAPPSDLVQF